MPDDVSIMRPGPWGNPFIIGRDGTRAEVVAKHMSDLRYKLKRSPNALVPLIGKTLVCCCAPLACHGDNYVALIQEMYFIEPLRNSEVEVFKAAAAKLDAAPVPRTGRKIA